MFVFLRGSVFRADSSAPRQFNCPDDRDALAADGIPRREWEVALESGEVLFIPEGWELSALHPVGARGAGATVVAMVPFGWEYWNRECC